MTCHCLTSTCVSMVWTDHLNSYYLYSLVGFIERIIVDINLICVLRVHYSITHFQIIVWMGSIVNNIICIVPKNLLRDII